MHKNNKIILICFSFIFLAVAISFFVGEKHNEKIAKQESELAKGMILYQEGNYVQSEENFSNLKDSSFGNSYFFNINFARILVENGKYDDALVYYKKVYNIQPRYLSDKGFIEELNRIEGLANNE